MMIKKREKKAQSQVITTVFLILISIAAVAVVSVFVMNMIKDNMKSTDCFKATSQFEIKLPVQNEGLTCFNSPNSFTYITIQRGSTEFNLTGILVSLGNDEGSKAYTIKQQSGINDIFILKDGIWSNDSKLPKAGEKLTYVINNTKDIRKITIVPVMKDNCEQGKAETQISAC